MINIYTICPTDYFGSNCYLIGSNGAWAVIDPSVTYSKAVSKYPEIEGKVEFVLLTHAHFDHIYAIDTWAEVTKSVYLGRADAEMLSDASLNCYLGFLGINGGYNGSYSVLDDGDTVILGDTKISVIATPGHTKGSVCYKVDGVVFTGDTLFSGGGYGRCDLPTGNEDELWKSIFKLFSKNMIGKFYPGHGFPDTFENSINHFN